MFKRLIQVSSVYKENISSSTTIKHLMLLLLNLQVTMVTIKEEGKKVNRVTEVEDIVHHLIYVIFAINKCTPVRFVGNSMENQV